MTDQVHTYIHKTFEVLDKKIDYIRDNYAPINVTISGNLTSNGNTVIGDNDSDLLTVNAIATFNSDLNANLINVENLCIMDNTVIGQDCNDTLVVNGSASFSLNSNVEFNGEFAVRGNATFGTDCTNTVECSGNVVAQHFILPTNSGNSMKIGCEDVIVYIESSSNINIYENYPRAVIITIKNTSCDNISITYDSCGEYNVQSSGAVTTYLKRSTTEFRLVAPSPL